MAVLEDEQGSLIITAGDDGAVRSWRVDGQPGPLNVPDPHNDRIEAVAVLETEHGPLNTPPAATAQSWPPLWISSSAARDRENPSDPARMRATQPRHPHSQKHVAR